MQKFALVLILLAFFSCSDESTPSAVSQNPVASTNPTEPTKPDEPMVDIDPILAAKYEVLKKEFQKEGLLCEESHKSFCFSEDSRQYSFYALEAMMRIFKLKNKEEILESFEKFIDLESRTLNPKESL